MFLNNIRAFKRQEVEGRKEKEALPQLREKVEERTEFLDIASRIKKAPGVSLIAEIKKASPSKGIIRENVDPVEIAGIYRDCGAAAVSVLTDGQFFQGRLSYLSDIKRVFSDLPLLQKDFIIDEFQIYEGIANHADALLLIAAILSQSELERYIAICYTYKVLPLVEVHTETELTRALDAGAQVIGINNRDLRTFTIDRAITERLIPMVPEGKTIISESGIENYEQVKLLEESGVDGVLIGEVFMRAPDIRAEVIRVMGRTPQDA